MKDNKGIIKGKQDSAARWSKNDWEKGWDDIMKKTESEFPNETEGENISLRRLKDYQVVFFHELSKIEDRIDHLEKILKSIIKPIGAIEAELGRPKLLALHIEDAINNKDSESLKVLKNLVKAMSMEANNLKPFRDTKNKKPKGSPKKDELIQLIADNKEDILKETTDKAKYVEIQKAYRKKYYTEAQVLEDKKANLKLLEVPSNSHIRTALKEFLSRK